jgi:hypothetical protein
MHRSLNYALRGLFALSLLAPAAVLTTSPVAAASVAVAPVAAAQVVTSHIIAATTTCGNSLGSGAGAAGRGLICNTTIVNTVTATGGSAVVTVQECFGSAGSPIDGTGPGGFACVTDTSNLTSPVTVVNQCNSSINGGGGVLRCRVVVTTNFVNVSSGATAARSVNQCVGSGAGGIAGVNIHCNPFPATTSGAAITQCNGSANGLTLVTPEGLTCAATGTMASAKVVTINQCNGSTNGGGAVVNCSANMVTEVNGVVVGVGGGGGGGTAPPTSTSLASGSTSNSSTPPFGLLIAFALAGLGLAVVLNRRRSAHN